MDSLLSKRRGALPCGSGSEHAGEQMEPSPDALSSLLMTDMTTTNVLFRIPAKANRYENPGLLGIIHISMPLVLASSYFPAQNS
jgi:hypothetical protein